MKTISKILVARLLAALDERSRPAPRADTAQYGIVVATTPLP